MPKTSDTALKDFPKKSHAHARQAEELEAKMDELEQLVSNLVVEADLLQIRLDRELPKMRTSIEELRHELRTGGNIRKAHRGMMRLTQKLQNSLKKLH